MLAFTGLVVLVASIFLVVITTTVQNSLRAEFLGEIIGNTKGEAAVISDLILGNNEGAIVDYAANEKFSHRGMAYLLAQDENGVLLASTLPNESLEAILQKNQFPQWQSQADTQLVDEKGQKIYNIALRLPNGKGTVITGYYEQPIRDSVWKIIFILIATMCGLIVLAQLYAVYFSARLVKPFNKLKSVVVKAAAGDFSSRAKIKSSDEIGYFADVLNKMLDNLENLQKGAVSKYTDLIENTPLCIKVFDKDRKLVFINKGGRDEHKIAAGADLSKWDWVDTIKEEYQADARAKFEHAFKYGEGSRVVYEHKSDGSNRPWCSSLITPLKNKNGEIESVLFISSDITQLKEAEAESDENAQLFRTLLDAVPYCIKWYDGHGKLISINRHGKEEHFLTNKSDAEIQSWHFADGVALSPPIF